jgi:hypothetical protein
MEENKEIKKRLSIGNVSLGNLSGSPGRRSNIINLNLASHYNNTLFLNSKEPEISVITKFFILEIFCNENQAFL